MDGVHDLGGKAGFGPVVAEVDEPVFHADWERRMLGVAASAMLSGTYTTPAFRYAIERMDPVHYLSSPYYEHWLTAVATLMVEAGVVDGDELRRRAGTFPLANPLPESVAVGDPPSSAEPAFAEGDEVRVRNVRSHGHTRCPGYVRDRTGRIARVNGAEPVPELEAHAGQRLLEPCYAVRFEPSELWGEDAEAGAGAVYVDLMERYLEAT